MRRYFTFMVLLAGTFLTLFLCAGLVIAALGFREVSGEADVAVVLGNEVLASGEPSPRLQARLDRALELHRVGRVKAVVVSGGTGRSGHDESAVMAAYLVQHGIPDGSVVRDPQGLNTWMTARNMRGLMQEHGWQGVVAVSQFFHLPRTRLALRKHDIQPVYTARARYYELRDVYSTAREVVGFAAYFFRRAAPSV